MLGAQLVLLILALGIPLLLTETEMPSHSYVRLRQALHARLPVKIRTDLGQGDHALRAEQCPFGFGGEHRQHRVVRVHEHLFPSKSRAATGD
ncbi:hypothetical protein ALO70_200126 [Pseudomonas amygdali pv. eriobotryae]|uniref:Transcriptional regulator n=1 Tax=Pseudomonas amygdali pv. eriobotryae TaxID=129137 RepID=A0A0P9QJ96_PSEA0|nr:hypothetical protein ALO70_200126 [Pseudomonas amygdali pv. eriobotryae]